MSLVARESFENDWNRAMSLSLVLAVFATLQGLPVHPADKTEPDRDTRMLVNAEAITSAARAVPVPDAYTMAAYLVEQGQADSAWLYRVQVGQCRSYECDPYRCLIEGKWSTCFKARGPWQVHRDDRMTDAQWDAFNSLEQADVDYAALHTARVMAYYYRTCGGSVGVFNGLANGKCLPFAGAERRASEAKAIAAKIRGLVRG